MQIDFNDIQFDKDLHIASCYEEGKRTRYFIGSKDNLAALGLNCNAYVGATVTMVNSRTVEQARQMQEEIKKALPVIIRLLSDPCFVQKVNDSGYKINTGELFNIFKLAANWRESNTPNLTETKK